jgi:hypothetical protein
MDHIFNDKCICLVLNCNSILLFFDILWELGCRLTVCLEVIGELLRWFEFSSYNISLDLVLEELFINSQSYFNFFFRHQQFLQFITFFQTLEHHLSLALDQGKFLPLFLYYFLGHINIMGFIILFPVSSFKYASNMRTFMYTCPFFRWCFSGFLLLPLKGS